MSLAITSNATVKSMLNSLTPAPESIISGDGGTNKEKRFLAER
jgi:hypothetical protein